MRAFISTSVIITARDARRDYVTHPRLDRVNLASLIPPGGLLFEKVAREVRLESRKANARARARSRFSVFLLIGVAE